MQQKEKRDLQDLDNSTRLRVVFYWRWLLIKQRSRRLRPVQLVLPALCCELGVMLFALTREQPFIPLAVGTIVIAGLAMSPSLHRRRAIHWME